LKLITPDNTTTLQNYVDSYPTGNLNSNHWVGSNSILKVVDENTKVYKTDNLFVVDVSSLPFSPCCRASLTIPPGLNNSIDAYGQPSRHDYGYSRAGRGKDPRPQWWPLSVFSRFTSNE
jgi:hypothetical protein